MAMRFSSAFMVPALAVGLAMPAVAQEVDQQSRQQIESVHTKFVEALNKGDVHAVSTASRTVSN
jgi:hypothetical protein